MRSFSPPYCVGNTSMLFPMALNILYHLKEYFGITVVVIEAMYKLSGTFETCRKSGEERDLFPGAQMNPSCFLLSTALVYLAPAVTVGMSSH